MFGQIISMKILTDKLIQNHQLSQDEREMCRLGLGWDALQETLHCLATCNATTMHIRPHQDWVYFTVSCHFLDSFRIFHWYSPDHQDCYNTHTLSKFSEEEDFKAKILSLLQDRLYCNDSRQWLTVEPVQTRTRHNIIWGRGEKGDNFPTAAHTGGARHQF